MKQFTFHITLSVMCLVLCVPFRTQAQDAPDYRRNSLAMMLVYHPEDEFGNEIFKAFDS